MEKTANFLEFFKIIGHLLKVQILGTYLESFYIQIKHYKIFFINKKKSYVIFTPFTQEVSIY